MTTDELPSAEDAQKLLDGTTPGPWRKRDCDVVVGEGLTAKTICHFWRHWSNDEEGIEQTEPNAALAAAAPDLARALIASEAARKDAEAAVALVVERVVEYFAAIERLAVSASIASCTCDIKTPDISFHAANCRYVKLEYIIAQCEDFRALAPASGVEALAALRAERRMIVSHATMGETDGEGLSLNEISVRITALRNSLYQEATRERDTLAAENAELRAENKRLTDAVIDAGDDRDRLAAANAAPEQSRDVVSWLDNGEKTYFSWAAGGGHPEGEFSSIGLRRETPDGLTLFRDYRATGPWHASALAEVQADARREGAALPDPNEVVTPCWQPIETAPRDGTWFRARTAHGTERTVHFADQYDRYPISDDGAVWSTAPAEWTPVARAALAEVQADARREGGE